MTEPYNVITFRCTTDEKRILTEKARRLGMCVSAYLRAHAYLTQAQDPINHAIPATHQTTIEEPTHAQEPTPETPATAPDDRTIAVP